MLLLMVMGHKRTAVEILADESGPMVVRKIIPPNASDAAKMTVGDSKPRPRQAVQFRSFRLCRSLALAFGHCFFCNVVFMLLYVLYSDTLVE